MKNTLVDAGPLIALFDRNDQYHTPVFEFLKKNKCRLISTWPVITEVIYMLDFSINAQMDFLTWIQKGGVKLFELNENHLMQIQHFMKKYSDLLADLADSSLLVASEKTGVKNILTIDRDLNIYRLENGSSLKNLLKST